MNIQEVINLTKLSRTQLLKYIKKGILKAEKINNRYQFDKSSVNNFIKNKQKEKYIYDLQSKYSSKFVNKHQLITDLKKVTQISQPELTNILNHFINIINYYIKLDHKIYISDFIIIYPNNKKPIIQLSKNFVDKL